MPSQPIASDSVSDQVVNTTQQDKSAILGKLQQDANNADLNIQQSDSNPYDWTQEQRQTLRLVGKIMLKNASRAAKQEVARSIRHSKKEAQETKTSTFGRLLGRLVKSK